MLQIKFTMTIGSMILSHFLEHLDWVLIIKSGTIWTVNSMIFQWLSTMAWPLKAKHLSRQQVYLP